MPAAKTWRFEQLRGPRKVIELTGWAAPHGRPRQNAVVRDGIEIRKAEVYYPGNDDGPTRHLFGKKYKPWELQGRFRDRAGGPGFATKMVEEVKQFVADQQPVRVSWGDIASVVGFVDEFDPGREGEGEVEWTLRLSVDSDDFATKKRDVRFVARGVGDAAAALASEMGSMLGGEPDLDLDVDIFDALDTIANLPGTMAAPFLELTDSLVSQVTGLAGTFQKAANSIASLEKATFAQLNRLVTVSVQMQGAITTFRETFTSARTDSALLRDRASENAALWTTQTRVEQSSAAMMAILSDLVRDIRIQLAGRPRESYIVRGGDTWESISRNFYGSPDRAADVAQANGAAPGAAPVPGVEIVIPT